MHSMIKPHCLFLTFIVTLSSCKGNSDKDVVSMSADSVAVVAELDTMVVADSALTEDHNVDTLPSWLYKPKATDTSPPKVKNKLSKAYNEGYDNGYEDGYEDAIDRNAFRESYDESCSYKGKKLDDYEEGYEDGYDDGWYDGKADEDVNDSQEDEEYDY